VNVLLSAGMIQGGRSGVGRYVISLAASMVAEQPGVTLFVAGLDADRELFPFLKDEQWISIPVRMSGGAANLIWHQFSLGRITKNRGIDLIHIPSYRRMLVCSPVPQVATIHDCAPFVLREKYDFARGFFGRIIVPWIARRVNHIVAVSETTGKDIIRFMKVPGERITVVPNGINHELFYPRSLEEIAAFKSRKKIKRPFFLYVARLEHPAKNHVRLIHAFESLMEAGLYDGELILPGAPWHGSGVIEQAVVQSPWKNRIRLEGYVDNMDLPLWYAAADALVFPSLMEGFGLPLLEAQACGTRIASSDATSLPEVAGPAGILFNGLDETSIGAAMQQLAGMSREERSRRETEGLTWAGGFTWSAHAANCVRIYSHTLKTV